MSGSALSRSRELLRRLAWLLVMLGDAYLAKKSFSPRPKQLTSSRSKDDSIMPARCLVWPRSLAQRVR